MMKKRKIIWGLLLIILIAGIFFCVYIFHEYHEKRIIKVNQEFRYIDNVGIKVIKYKSYRDWGTLHIEGECKIINKLNNEIYFAPSNRVSVKYENGSVEPMKNKLYQELNRGSSVGYIKRLNKEDICINNFEGSLRPRNKVVAFSVILGVEERNKDGKYIKSIIGKSEWINLED